MAQFSNSYIVCKCNNVSLGEIVYAINEKDAKTIDDLKNLTDAGTLRGCCIDSKYDINVIKKDLYLSQILNKFIKSD